MELEQARKRAEELRVIIERNNRLYYDQDAPELEDFEYDALNRELVRQQKILSVIDERRELFAGNAPGEALDVLAGLPKGQAVQMALRTLSPQVILLDELGGLDEVTALEQGLFSGVDFVATLHAATPEEATMRPQVKYLMERGAVRVLVWLTGRQAPGCIGEVRFL